MRRPESFLGERCLTMALLVAVLLAAGAAFAAVEPPDYPAAMCPWLQMIPYNAPIDPNSNALILDLKALAGNETRFRLQLGKWTMAKYTINGSNYNVEDVYLSTAWGPTGYWLRNVPIPTDQTLKVTKDSDAAIEIIDPIHGIEYTFWACTYDASGGWKRNRAGYLEAMTGEAVYLYGSGSSPVGEAARGCGIASSLGLILPGELAAGTVNHALAYFFPNPAPDPCPPATHSDGGKFGTPVYYPNRLPESAVFRLKPSVWTDQAIENSGWNWTEKTLARAARDYGLYVSDNTGTHHIAANFYGAYPSDPYVDIPGVQPGDRVVNQYVRLWTPGLLDPANFEVIDTVTFPYIEDDRRADYDGDGIINAAETAWGYRDNTYYAQHQDPANGPVDWDNDGLTNAQECSLRNYFHYLTLNPYDADSDGDGYTDLQETNNWSADPTDPFVTPNPSWPGIPTGANLALNKSTTSVNFANPQLAVDGNEATATEAPETMTGSITVDLGASTTINRVVLKWLYDFVFAVGYTVQVSPDNSAWTTVYTETRGSGGRDDCWGLTANGRYVKVNVTALGSPWGLALHELAVYGPGGPPQPPVANFSGNPTSGTAPLNVAFTDQSTNSPTSWSWNFGDSSTSTAQNPSHSYAAGTYTVSLRATNAYGYDDEVKTNYITATSGGGGDYTCDSLTKVNGVWKSGDHTSVHASDDQYYVLGYQQSFKGTRVDYTFNTGLSSLSSLSFTVEGKVSTGTQTQTVYVFNYSTSQYDSQGTSTLTTSDTTFTASVASPSNYISGGTVKVRVQVGPKSSPDYDHSTDLVKITAAP